MFIKLLSTIFIMLTMMTSVFAVEGFTKEGGGYGVKPIRELIKESEEGQHSSVNLNDWLEQREKTPDIITILARYKKAIKIRKQIMAMYDNVTSEEDFREFRRKILFIQGLLIIKIDNLESVTLTNNIERTREELLMMQSVVLNIIGIQIEDGYIIIDLLKEHTIQTVTTNLQGNTQLELTTKADSSSTADSISDDNRSR